MYEEIVGLDVPEYRVITVYVWDNIFLSESNWSLKRSSRARPHPTGCRSPTPLMEAEVWHTASRSIICIYFDTTSQKSSWITMSGRLAQPTCPYWSQTQTTWRDTLCSVCLGSEKHIIIDLDGVNHTLFKCFYPVSCLSLIGCVFCACMSVCSSQALSSLKDSLMGYGFTPWWRMRMFSVHVLL